MKKENLIKIILAILLITIFGIYVWLRLENSQYVREPRMGFGDTNDYLQMSTMSLFSSSFWLSVKPPVIPIFLKLLGGAQQ